MLIRGRLIIIENEQYLLSGTRYFPIKGIVGADMYDLCECEGTEWDGVIIAERTRVLQHGTMVGGHENWKKMVYDTGFKAQMIEMQLAVNQMRSFFLKMNFLEVYTPVAAPYAAMEPNIDSFETTFGRDKKLYLQTSPEYYMKKLLAADLYQNIFQICPVFRNNENGNRHNPEFLMLEWYRQFAPYETLMDDCFGLIKACAKKDMLTYQGQTVLLDAYEKLTVADAFERYAAMPLDALGVYDDVPGWEERFFQILVEQVEPRLGWERPTVLCEYPAKLAALASLKKDDPRVANRFELYICGIELANCFEELCDAEQQYLRFEAEQHARMKAGKPVYDIDKTFIQALKTGMPPSSGGALGIQRLLMVLFDVTSIRETLLFPYEDL